MGARRPGYLNAASRLVRGFDPHSKQADLQSDWPFFWWQQMTEDHDIPHLRQIAPETAADLCERAIRNAADSYSLRIEINR